MNRTRKPIPASWLKAPGYFFLLAVLPGFPGLRSAAASQPVEALNSNTAAKLLLHVEKPRYPTVAKVNLIEGTVKLHITVSAEGKVIAAHVAEGEPLLAAAAIRAVQKWLYHPYKSPEGPAEFRTIVVVKFLLNADQFGRHTPKDAESFLEKQIHPPEVVTQPRTDPSAATVRLKLLIDSKGEVLDAAAMGASDAEAEAARENLRQWKFRPAHWGAIAVPWYIIVNVPYKSAVAVQTGYSAKH